MYSIITVTDGIERTIYDPSIGSFLVQSPKLTEELNQPGSLEFTLLYGHDAFGHLEALKTYVTAYKDDEEIFYGRVLSVEPNVLLGTEEIVCEGAISFLNDGYLPPDPRNSSTGTYTHQTQTAEEFFNRVIDAYNADVDDYRRMFTVGEVSHSRKSESREYQITNYMSAKEALENELINQYGGFLRIRADEEGYLIDWIESYGRTNEGTVELGENVITQTNRMSGEDMFTAIRPVGKDGLIHSTIPVIDIYSEEDMLSYGRVIKNVDFPNITTEAALLAAGSSLAERISKTLYISSEISLLDLHVVDEEEPDVRLGDEFNNISGLENVSLVVSSRTSDFENPQNDSISLKNAKSLEGNGLDDFRNDGNSLSKRSAKNSGGVGMALKYYSEAVTELGSQVKIVANNITLAADKLMQIHADQFIQTGANLETLSTTVLNTTSLVQHIEGTGVIQNSEAITTLAGQFEVTRDPSDSLWRVKLIEGAQLQVQKDGIYSDVVNLDGMSSAIQQTASGIRAEVNSAKSELSSSIEQTAESIRSEVNAANSTIYSSITQTASNIRAEVASVDSALSTSIEQTAGEIRSEANAASSTIYSAISQTASQIRSEVATIEGNMHSAINQTASSIMLEVSKNAKVFHQYSDPASTETVKDKDLWIKDAGVQTHGKAANFTYGELGDFKLADFYGSEIYVRKNGEWVKIGGDQLTEYNTARLEVDEGRISMITDSMSGDYAEFIVELGRIHSRVEDVEEGLTSAIEQTASMIRSAVWTANSEMYSEIIQTQSMIRTEVGDAESNLRSEFTQTAAGLNAKIGNKSRVFRYNRSPIRHADARALLAQMWNDGELVSGDLWVYDPSVRTHGEAAQKTYGALATNTYADFYGCDIFEVLGADNVRRIGGDQLANLVSADIGITKEHFNYVTGSADGRIGALEVSRDQIKTSVVDLRRDLGSSITQTASEIRSAVWASQSQIYSSISQTASAIRLEVTNKIESVSSSITQTASQIRSEVNTANSRIYSAITQTASQIRLEVTNKIESVSSSITQTASQIRSEVNTANSRIYSSITQTASQIRLEVTNKVSSLQSQITQSANKIALVVKNGGIDAASIVTAVNAQTGSGTIRLKADMIKLDGAVTIADVLELGDNANAYLHNSELEDPEIIHSMSFDQETATVNCGYGNWPVGDVIVRASKSNNVLTLYTMDGEEITFSKATTLSSSWSGSNSARVLTMTAKQNNTTVATRTVGIGTTLNSHDIDLSVDSNGTPTYTPPTGGVTGLIDCPVKIAQLVSGGSTTYYTKSIQFNTNSLLQEKTATSNGSVTPDSSYIGLKKVTVNVSPATVSSITASSVDPSYPNDSNGNNITVTLSSGATTTQAITLNKGSWSSGHIAVNAYLGDTSGTRFDRIWIDVPNASGFNKNESTYNTYQSQQVASFKYNALTANTYMYWTVGGKKYHIVVNA